MAGEVTPDNFLVDKVMLEIGKRIISNKEYEYALTEHDKVMKQKVEDERATAPSLTDAEIKAIAALAKRAEKHYGCPQDIEWAIDKDLPEGENVILLQARPETVWSKKGVTTVTVSSGTSTIPAVTTARTAEAPAASAGPSAGPRPAPRTCSPGCTGAARCSMT